MKDTPEVREALLEMSVLLGNIAQGKLNAIPQTQTLEELTVVARTMGMAESATFLRSVYDALCESDFLPRTARTNAQSFVH